MSFLGYLAAGAGEGLGKGMVGEADYGDKLNLQREILADRQAGDLQRQRERLDDQAALKLQLAQMKQDGSGSGGHGLNLFDLAQRADTPEKQARLTETVRAFQGDDAANVLARIYGKGDTETVSPTAGDFARFDRQADPETGANDAAVPAPSFVQRAQFDADKGRQGLSRLMALVSNPNATKGNAEGEAQYLRNDVTANITLPKALKDPTADTGDINEALSPLNPKAGLEEDKNSLAGERNRIRQQEADDKKARGESQLGERQKTLLLNERKAHVATAKDMMADPDQQAAAKARIAEIDNLLKGASAAPVSPATTTKPRSPAAAASAYKAGQRY